MANDYGVYKDGTNEWVTNEMPLTWGSEDQALNNYSYVDGITVATYLTNTTGFECRVGRPGDRQNH